MIERRTMGRENETMIAEEYNEKKRERNRKRTEKKIEKVMSQNL